jgi:hypothetical protein
MSDDGEGHGSTLGWTALGAGRWLKIDIYFQGCH